MQRHLLVSLPLVLLAVLPIVPAQPPAGKHEIQLNGHTFTLPEGFTIELAAGPPLVDRPITAAFDEQGRLYVADSSGSNEKVQVQLEKKPHRIVRLEDTDGDGRFDKRTIFADRMMFPEGTMWYKDSLYVAAPPSIWKLTDTDGDGVADQRSEWFQGKTLTGCANDLHGPYLGPDGWIYWCKGAFANQSYERPGQPPFRTRAAHIFRCRPNGSGLEPVMTGGMDNPVDLAFTPGGERIFTTTFLQFPGGGKRDGLLHNVYGGIYGKDWDVIHDPAHKWTGSQVLPVLSHLGPAAPCGLTSYESNAFGTAYQHNLFAALFNLQKVTRHVLTPEGGTFHSKDEDFVVSNNKDFHPTDVLEDADGSLLVVDTGGWYKLCCPTSQLYKPDILGGIYRVRRQQAPRMIDPRGRQQNWSEMSELELAGLLGDARPAVRWRAVQTLSERGSKALPVLATVLQRSTSPQARLHAVWTAARIEGDPARDVVRQALADTDDTVRQAALHSVSLWRDGKSVAAVLPLLKSASRHNRRAAAEALGRSGDRAAVPALLTAAADARERMLQHSITYALIEIAAPEATAAGLQSDNPLTRRAALIALDQMERGNLQSVAVTKQLDATDAGLREAAWWIASRHPEWGSALESHFRERLAKAELPAGEREQLVQQLSQLSKAGPIQDLLARQLANSGTPSSARRLALQAMARAELKAAPAAWLEALTQVLSGADRSQVPEAVTTLRTLRLPKQPPEKLLTVLRQLGSNPEEAAQVRLGALAALPGGLTSVQPALFTFLKDQLRSEQPALARTLSADVLVKAKLTPEQLLVLAESIRTVGPLEVNRLLEAFQRSRDDKLGRQLLAALQDSPVRTALRVDALKATLGKFGPAVQKQAETLYAALEKNAGQQRAKLEQMLATLARGDIRRGQLVFNSSKAACVSCHSIGYLGGKIGPDLTRIGQIRSERDLLEAILFPSASFVRSYEPLLVVTSSGKTVNGLLRKDTPEEIVLVVGANQEERIPRQDIEEILPGQVSVMPAGLDQQLSPQDLADLVAFLRACR